MDQQHFQTSMNLQAYANHRKARGLRGTSHVAVLNAINDGRLTAPAVQRNGRSWVINPDLADQQWAARTDPSKTPTAALPYAPQPANPLTPSDPQPKRSIKNQELKLPPDPSAKGLPDLSVSKAIRAAYDAKMAQLQYQKETEELVPARQVQEEAFTMARVLRDRLMTIPDRIAPMVSGMTTRDAHQLISEEIQVTLRKLADGD